MYYKTQILSFSLNLIVSFFEFGVISFVSCVRLSFSWYYFCICIRLLNNQHNVLLFLTCCPSITNGLSYSIYLYHDEMFQSMKKLSYEKASYLMDGLQLYVENISLIVSNNIPQSKVRYFLYLKFDLIPISFDSYHCYLCNCIDIFNIHKLGLIAGIGLDTFLILIKQRNSFVVHTQFRFPTVPNLVYEFLLRFSKQIVPLHDKEAWFIHSYSYF